MSSNAFTVHEILKTNSDAGSPTFRKAYLQMALELHPDKNPGSDDSTAAFQSMQALYDYSRDELGYTHVDYGVCSQVTTDDSDRGYVSVSDSTSLPLKIGRTTQQGTYHNFAPWMRSILTCFTDLLNQ